MTTSILNDDRSSILKLRKDPFTQIEIIIVIFNLKVPLLNIAIYQEKSNFMRLRFNNLGTQHL